MYSAFFILIMILTLFANPYELQVLSLVHYGSIFNFFFISITKLFSMLLGERKYKANGIVIFVIFIQRRFKFFIYYHRFKSKIIIPIVMNNTVNNLGLVHKHA